jgi:hypothetical protein
MLLLLVLLYLSNSKFLPTKNFYDGTLGYDGFVKGCAKEYEGSVPCDKLNLLNESWKYNLPISWIFTPDTNCLGYSTNDTDMFGQCISSIFNYATLCSCDIVAQLCCFRRF